MSTLLTVIVKWIVITTCVLFPAWLITYGMASGFRYHYKDVFGHLQERKKVYSTYKKIAFSSTAIYIIIFSTITAFLLPIVNIPPMPIMRILAIDVMYLFSATVSFCAFHITDSLST